MTVSVGRRFRSVATTANCVIDPAGLAGQMVASRLPGMKARLRASPSVATALYLVLMNCAAFVPLGVAADPPPTNAVARLPKPVADHPALLQLRREADEALAARRVGDGQDAHPAERRQT